MPDDRLALDAPSIKVGGSELSEDIHNKLLELVVDSSLHVPDMFILKFTDEDMSLVSGSTFDLGKEVEIKMTDHSDPSASRGSTAKELLIKGEITALEPVFEAGAGNAVTMVV